jgi:hypothetical protein
MKHTNGGEKRRSERVIPVVSEEEVVLIDSGDGRRSLAKMLDISDGGTLVYLLVDSDIEGDVGDSCTLMLYHQGKIFEAVAAILRKSGKLIGFRFGLLKPDVQRLIQSKLIRMEIEWTRLKQHTI